MSKSLLVEGEDLLKQVTTIVHGEAVVPVEVHLVVMELVVHISEKVLLKTTSEHEETRTVQMPDLDMVVVHHTEVLRHQLMPQEAVEPDGMVEVHPATHLVEITQLLQVVVVVLEDLVDS